MPEFDIQVRASQGSRPQVYDPLRLKWVALTPEEWVRQHFVHFLVSGRGYPQHLMANEVALQQNGCQRRCDTVVYDQYAQAVAIVEYKAPEVSITERVFDQIVRYNMELRVKCLIVSNGIKHYCCRIEGDKWVFLRDIPAYDEIMRF